MQKCSEQSFTRDILASPDRIVVATDLVDLDCLLPHAIAQAKASGSKVTIVHAIYPLYIASLETALVPSDYEKSLIRDVRMKVVDATHQMATEGIHCDITVRIGSAGDVIREELSRSHSSRLIMGTHGRGRLRQFALGSVAHELITKVGVPIFVVGPHARDNVKHANPRSILHPVSFVGDYLENCRLALDIAKAYGAELTLLHVLEKSEEESTNPGRSMTWAQNTLGQFIPEVADHSPAVHVKVLFGQVAGEILKAASQIGADWIVLSTDQGAHSGFFKETRAFEVLANANCPVLTLGR